ncbi:MAG: hypothetical protein BWY82_01254 [Verrucomicrobia bacterium ADurb.Bin474]|nr:MAG: hypothetical protein BWY82_01254 [Verrucomicrobia bacterium ADurb.Bin474]
MENLGVAPFVLLMRLKIFPEHVDPAFRDELTGDFVRRIALHPKLRNEPVIGILEVFRGSQSMPDRPVMGIARIRDIAHGPVRANVQVQVTLRFCGRGTPIRTGSIEFIDPPGEPFFEDLHILRTQPVGTIVLQVKLDLIVSAPQCKASMMLESRDLSLKLTINPVQHFRSPGIDRTGKHEILPHHQPELITQIVKLWHFIDPATPNPDHVHVRLHTGFQK